MNNNSMNLFKDTIKLKNCNRPPVWFMRQAGRYMSEYVDLKSRYTFLELCKTPELAIKITLLPEKILNIDILIIFSDILTLLEFMGMHLEFKDKVGPILTGDFNNITYCSSDLRTHFKFIEDIIKGVKSTSKLPLLGFSGAPFTLLAYALQSNSSLRITSIKKMIYSHPELINNLLDKITLCIIDYLKAQIDWGVDGVQIFDTWAGYSLNNIEFNSLIIPRLKLIFDTLKKEYKDIPISYFTKNIYTHFKSISKIGFDVISIDSMSPMYKIRELYGFKYVIQGNLDPFLLAYGSKKDIYKSVTNILQMMSNDKGFIFNLGHGVIKETPVSNVKYVVDLVKNFT